MAKVGIVTFHSAHNFGAVLQCVGLKNVLIELGHDVSVIDYRNPEIEKFYTVKKIASNFKCDKKWFKRLIADILRYKNKKARSLKFNEFINKYILDTSKHNLNFYDCIVWGSDQIWRCDITDSDTFYWGNCNQYKGKKISYAASAGQIDYRLKESIKFLRNFDAISVRERELQDFLKDEGIESEVSLDPTLLVNQAQWERILPLKQTVNKPYILVYSMRNRVRVNRIAQKISHKENLPIKEIFNNCISVRDIFKEYSTGDPIDFISLIKNSKFIVTDSFHGTVFSIIFNKKFITVRQNDGYDNRSENLLINLGLEERMSVDGKNYKQDIDYETVNSKLSKLQEQSYAYLRNNI